MMSDWKDEFVQKRWSKEDEFYNSGPVDPCQELREQNAALRETIARLEREKGLLQSFVIGGEGNCKHIFESMYVQSGAGDYFSCFLCSKCGGKLPPGEAADVLNAIDGGALE